MKSLTINHDSRDAGPRYLDDLTFGYWFSEVLFTAVEVELFTLLHPAGKTAGELADILGYKGQGTQRFLHALCTLGLLQFDGSVFSNTTLAANFLVKGKKDYQGDVILWRKHLSSNWHGLGDCLKAGGRVAYPYGEDPDQFIGRVRRYISAMDGVARVKIQEILPVFKHIHLTGEILDVGAGSGAMAAGFLERFPLMRAILIDMPEVLDYAEELMQESAIRERVACCRANLLEPLPVPKGCFDLVILSNIIHVYSEIEVCNMLAGAAECLNSEGFLLIHDYFLQHSPARAALYDLNMFINTYNGRIFSYHWLRENLKRLKLHVTGLIPLKSDTALIVASKNERSLSFLRL